MKKIAYDRLPVREIDLKSIKIDIPLFFFCQEPSHLTLVTGFNKNLLSIKISIST